MKMIIVVLKDESVEKVLTALTAADFRVTRVASTGGFFRSGSTTLIIGVNEERVDAAIDLIRQNCAPAQAGQKRATLFVVPVSHFEQI
jgi:uncharacterized protein YaaQ